MPQKLNVYLNRIKDSGIMTIPQQLNDFLATAQDLLLGYNGIIFSKLDALNDAQIGYSVDENGKSLTTGNIGDWQQQWIVIADDSLGDPIFIDTSSPKLKVMGAAHGEDIWEPFIIADSLDNFKQIISQINAVAKGRTEPDELEKNPISDEEQAAVLKLIEKQNPKTDVWYWENFFENDF